MPHKEVARIAHPSHARNMALRYAPTVYQYFQRWYDPLANLDAPDIGVESREPETCPEIYYSARTDPVWTHIFYGFYHRRDCSHQHDFEGAQISIPKNGTLPCVVMARAHHCIDAWTVRMVGGGWEIDIEGDTHAIRPHRPRNATVLIYRPSSLILKNLHTNRSRYEKKIYALGPVVTPPVEWNDARFTSPHRRAWLKKKLNTSSIVGLFWNDPGTMIEIYNQTKLINLKEL